MKHRSLGLASIRVTILVIILATINLMASWTFAEEIKTLYIQAATAKLKSEAKVGSKDVAKLIRGDSLQVLEIQEGWYKVRFNSETGWISKLFVSPTKPMNQSELIQSNDVSPEKTSRKRSSAYAVSAATRGLSAGSRGRDNQQKYRSNDQALEKLEKNMVDEGALEQFQKKGNLNPDQATDKNK